MEKIKMVFFCTSLIIVFFSIGCVHKKSEPLAKFFKDNNYNLIYPLNNKPAPGAIYEETKDKGLGQVLAFKETCAKDLKPDPGKISFGTRSATSEVGLNFLLGLSQQLVPVEADLKGAFNKEVSYTVTSDEMDTSSCDWVTLRKYVREEMPPGDCQEALLRDDAVVLSSVAATKKFTFKFKGLKSGGIEAILQSFINAGLTAERKDEETIVLKYAKPMNLCYQRWTPKELGVLHRVTKGLHEDESLEEEDRTAPPFTLPDVTKGLHEDESLEEEAVLGLSEPAPPNLNDFTKNFFGIKE